jgi:hypothetical protein
METESTTLTSKVSIPHLLLNKYLWNTHSRIVHRIHLSADWSPLVASSDRSNTCGPIMNIVLSFLSCTCTVSPARLTFLDYFISGLGFVPNKVCETISLNELIVIVISCRRLVRVYHIKASCRTSSWLFQ